MKKLVITPHHQELNLHTYSPVQETVTVRGLTLRSAETQAYMFSPSWVNKLALLVKRIL